MKEFKEEFIESLDAAYDKLMKYEFLDPVRSKSEAVADVKIIGNEWTETKEGSNGRKWVKRYLLVENGNTSSRTGKRFQIKAYREEFYQSGELRKIWYNTTGCTGRFDTLLKMVSECVLRHDNNFHDGSARFLKIW